MWHRYLTRIIALHLLAVCGAAVAQEDPQPQMTNGIVLSNNGDVSFVVVDRSGQELTVAVKPATTYIANKNEATFKDAIQPGMRVRCIMASQGVAAQVIARGQADQLNLSQLRAFMRASDEEWTVLSPKIETILALQRQLDGSGNNGNNGDNGRSPAENQMRALLKSLQASFWVAGPGGNEFRASLNDLRALRAKARDELAQARKELTELVTPKQELLLVIQGILE